MPSQLKKLALTDTSDNTTLNFSVVQEGGAEASRQVLSIEPSDSSLSIENDRELVTSKDYDITVVGLYTSASDKSQLQTWAEDAAKQLKWSGIGLDDQILQADGMLNYQEDYEDNLTFRFNSPRRATGGYSTTTGKHTSELSYSKNGLALYKFGDADGDEEGDGWTFSGGSTTFDEANGEQDFSTTAVSGQTAYRQVYFPFGGEQVTFSLNVDAITVTTGVNLLIEEYNSSDTLITTATQALTAVGDGQSVSATLDSNTIYIRCVVDIGQDDSISWSAPALNMGTATNFVEFNT